MTRILYDLALADEEVRPSPYCWLVKFALLHKGLKFETRPVGFADKSKYPDPDYGKVPVLIDDGMMVKDSAVILEHLERKYRGRPLAATPDDPGRVFAYEWLLRLIHGLACWLAGRGLALEDRNEIGAYKRLQHTGRREPCRGHKCGNESCASE